MTSINHNINDFSLWTALITPFDQHGQIDYDCLLTLVKKQQDSGNGILLCGSTGEGLALEPAEQLQLVEYVCSLNPTVPLMVGVGGFNLDAQIDWITKCNTLAVSAFLLTAPLYAKPGPVGQTQWFKALLDASTKPCMLYNVPSRAGVSIAEQVVKDLAEHPNLWAMKEASGDINEFLAYQSAAPAMRMYSGEDGLIPYLVSAGAVGLVSVCANAWPEATNLYVEKSLQGEGAKLYDVWTNAVNSLFDVANPIPVKVLMHKQGVINTPILRAPLTHLELTSDQNILNADDTIDAWLKSLQSPVRAIR